MHGHPLSSTLAPQGNVNLVALALKGNELGEEACRLLCQAIKFNRTLK